MCCFFVTILGDFASLLTFGLLFSFGTFFVVSEFRESRLQDLHGPLRGCKQRAVTGPVSQEQKGQSSRISGFLASISFHIFILPVLERIRAFFYVAALGCYDFTMTCSHSSVPS